MEDDAKTFDLREGGNCRMEPFYYCFNLRKFEKETRIILFKQDVRKEFGLLKLLNLQNLVEGERVRDESESESE